MRGGVVVIIPCLLLLLLLLASPSKSSFSCHPDHRDALLGFIRPFSIIDYHCGDASYPKVASWREDQDCCSWDGITCDNSTGYVVGLDLTCAGLHGSINSSSPLFSLRHLRRLSLAGNDLLGSAVPPEIGTFSHMTHLNLSDSNIAGILPNEISKLSKLISLDLSYSYFYQEMQDHTMRRLIHNLTQLEELNLGAINMSTVTPTSFINLSSSLISLKLSDCKLGGKFPEFIFGLPNLRVIDISWNDDLAISLPEHNWSPRLDFLSLGRCSFLGSIPNSIGNLSRLTHMDLSQNKFTGAVPSSIGNLSRLIHMDLSWNNFMGGVPNSIGKLSRLTHMDLSENNFTGGAVPDSIGNLSQLTYMDLSGNNFFGAVPNWIGNLSRLTYLDLSGNNFTGEFDIGKLSTLLELQYLGISGLSVSGEDENHGSSLPKLQELYMIRCNLSKFPSFLSSDSKELRSLELSENRIQEIPSWLWSIGIGTLEVLDLQTNIISGSIPPSICQLTSLSFISLGGNHLRGVIPQCLGNLTNLYWLDLRNNSLSGSLPSSLANCTSLRILVVSYNNMTGAPPTWPASISLIDLQDNNFDSWWPHDTFLRLHSLGFLVLSDKKFEGPLPLPSYTTRIYSVSNSHFSGSLSSLLCNATNLEVLDLSNNSLTGILPDCLKSVTDRLRYMNLRENEFRGRVPNIFHEGCVLTSLDLSRNRFEGMLPVSLSHCRTLEVLDVGDNKITGSFPNWLGGLPLKVLSLRSNNFHGHVTLSERTHDFSQVRIMDLSNNNFEGYITHNFIDRLLGMGQDYIYDLPNQYMSPKNVSWKSYSVMIDLKGVETEMVQINVQFAMLDLSSNHFHGDIPRSIGSLKSIRGLNFSHNRFTWMIPPSVGDLTYLESLDLSSNHFMGEIPKELVKLTSLGFLDLSWNNLTGPIPLGGHLNTFSSSSFQGNPGLCGIPLTRLCGQETKGAQPPSEGKDDGNKEGKGWMVWEYAELGFGTGIGIGISLGYMVLEMGRPLWLVRLVIRLEANYRKLSKKKKKGDRRGNGRR